MEHRPGTRADQSGERSRRTALLRAAGRGVGFVLLCGAALAIQAGVVLLPEYAELRQDLYARSREAATVADMEALAEAQDRLIAKLPTDPVLTKRIAMRQQDYWPDKSVATAEPGRQASRAPCAVRLAPHRRPAPPSAWLARASGKLANPATRRGLWLVSVGLLLAAVLMFASGHTHGSRRKKASGPGA